MTKLRSERGTLPKSSRETGKNREDKNLGGNYISLSKSFDNEEWDNPQEDLGWEILNGTKIKFYGFSSEQLEELRKCVVDVIPAITAAIEFFEKTELEAFTFSARTSSELDKLLHPSRQIVRIYKKLRKKFTTGVKISYSNMWGSGAQAWPLVGSITMSQSMFDSDGALSVSFLIHEGVHLVGGFGHCASFYSASSQGEPDFIERYIDIITTERELLDNPDSYGRAAEFLLRNSRLPPEDREREIGFSLSKLFDHLETTATLTMPVLDRATYSQFRQVVKDVISNAQNVEYDKNQDTRYSWDDCNQKLTIGLRYLTVEEQFFTLPLANVEKRLAPYEWDEAKILARYLLEKELSFSEERAASVIPLE